MGKIWDFLNSKSWEEYQRIQLYKKAGKVLIEQGRRITARHIALLDKAAIKTLEVPNDYVLGKVLAKTMIHPETGEVIGSANDIITGDILKMLVEAGVKRFEVLYVNDIDRGSYMSDTLRIDPSTTRR